VGKNGTPAERQRGLIFIEDFRSVDDVVRNGMVVGGGTPTFGPGYVTFDGASYLSYPVGNSSLVGRKTCTIDVELTALSAAGTQIAFIVGNVGAAAGAAIGMGIAAGKWCECLGGGLAIDTGVPVVVGQKTRLTVRYDGAVGGAVDIYVDGVYKAVQGATMTFVPPTIYIGGFGAASYFTGLVHSARAFTQQLSAEEVLQYATNRVYSYRSQPTINLQMRNTDHTATATLDTSGNGRHAVFGAGAATPTKLVDKHGYNFDGGDNMTAVVGGAFNTSGITFAFELEPDFLLTGGASYLYDTTNAARYLLVKQAAADSWLIFMNGTVIGAGFAAANGWRQYCRNVIAISSTSGKTNAWVNETRVMTDAATAWVVGDPTTLYIGSSNIPGSYTDGRITRFASYPQALTALQVYDLLTNWQMRASEA
jgi:hypothetical protein